MATVSDLGRKLKDKHPHLFGHLSDADAGRKAKQEYPSDYAHYEEEQGFMTSEGNFNYEPVSHFNHFNIDFQITPKIQNLVHKHNSDMGVFFSWLRRRKIEGQNRLLDAATEQELKLVKQVTLLANEVIEGRRKEVDFAYYIEQIKNSVYEMRMKGRIIQLATEAGMNPDDYSSWRKFEQQFKIQSIEKREEHKREEEAKEAEHQRELRKQELISELRIKEHKEKADKELDNEIKLAQEEARLAIIADYLLDNQQVILIQGLIDQQHKEIQDITANYNLDIETKGFMIADRKAIIAKFTQQRDETADRLLRTYNEKEIQK